MGDNQKKQKGGNKNKRFAGDDHFKNLTEPWQRNWISSIKATLGSIDKKPMIATVRRVPTRLRKHNNTAYDPSIISIGPIHHGKIELVAMEEHKWRYMLDLLRRTEDPRETVEKCCNSILGLDVAVRSSYAKELEYETQELAEMMLLDGCFILELILKNAGDDLQLKPKLPLIRRDIMLLENQIPFFILEKLAEIILSESQSPLSQHSIANFALNFFREGYESGNFSDANTNDSFSHLLDILHQSYPPIRPNFSKDVKLEYCATELVGAGIEIEHVDDHNILKISVDDSEKKRLKIPQLQVTEETESFLRNLIAFEQCKILGGGGYNFTSYAVFLNGLMCSQPDVDLLLQKKIIIDKSDGKVDLLAMFQGLVREVEKENFCYSYECYQLQDHGRRSCYRYLKSCSHRSRASCSRRTKRYVRILREEYCPNPWRIIQLFVAFSILVMTALQAYYSVKK